MLSVIILTSNILPVRAPIPDRVITHKTKDNIKIFAIINEKYYNLMQMY